MSPTPFNPQQIAKEAARQHSPHPMPDLEQIILAAAMAQEGAK